MAHPDDLNLRDGENAPQSFTPPAPFGRAAAADSKPVVLSTEDKAVIDALATQTTSAAILAKLSSDPATQTTLAAILAKLSSDPATQTTLAAILAKLTSDPATATNQTALSAIISAGITTFKPQQTVTDCTITIGTSTTISAAIDLGIYRAVGLVMPASFTGTSITFQSSYDGTNYVPVYDASGNATSVTVSTSRRIVLPPANFYGIRYLKIVSGTAEGADRTIKVIAEA